MIDTQKIPTDVLPGAHQSLTGSAMEFSKVNTTQLVVAAPRFSQVLNL